MVRLARFERATFGSGDVTDIRPSLSLNDLRPWYSTVFHGVFAILFPIGSQFCSQFVPSFQIAIAECGFDIESRDGVWERVRHFLPVGQRRLSSSNQFWTRIISVRGQSGEAPWGAEANFKKVSTILKFGS